MFLKNKDFIFAGVLILIQQILMAASTWSIAEAGIDVSENEFSNAKVSIVFFFGFALAAYIISAFSEYFTVHAENSIWENYVCSSSDKFSANKNLSSDRNRELLSKWLSSEALSTINNGVRFYLSFFSTALNVLLTSGVFFFTLGALIGSAVFISLLLSLIFVMVTKKEINTIATESQSYKINSLFKIDSLLVNGACGTESMYSGYKKNFYVAIKEYFLTTIAYVKIEQIVSCTPIIISVIIILSTIVFTDATNASQVGALVAVLPRSLQLLGSVHALSMYLSQFVMFQQKIKNLYGFLRKMHVQNFGEQINQQQITILEHSSNKYISMHELIEACKSLHGTKGRYTILGPNGSGKSSLLKLLKSQVSSSVLLKPNVNFGMTEQELSTGQSQKVQMSNIFKEPSKLLLLDEWDANLDLENITHFNDLIMNISSDKIVVEVRHHLPKLDLKVFSHTS